MQYEEVVFSRHAIMRMFELDIAERSVEEIVARWEIIKSYEYDKPYPSYLCLGFENSRPVHVVAAINEEEKQCIIVTVYVPDNSLWSKDFKTKNT